MLRNSQIFGRNVQRALTFFSDQQVFVIRKNSFSFIHGNLTKNLDANKNEEPEKFTVYVHWPFCKQLCTFCNFNKYVRENVNHARMRDCLVTELKTLVKLSGATIVKSVYFGGGTPSLAEPSTISAILDTVSHLCQLDQDAEVSLEANPSSSEISKLRSFKAAGVNRLSLGLQSLSSKDLALLGRDHTAEESLRCLEIAKELFPGRVSIDLLFGRPGQSVNEWEKELQQVLVHSNRHVSLYQLTLEAGTPLYKSVKAGHLSLPGIDTMADLYHKAVQVLEGEGFHRYEVSNFAKHGSESRHNLSYWNGGAYLGVGPGAHGRFPLESNGTKTRFARIQTLEPNSWMAEVEHFGHGTRQSIPQSTSEVLEEILVSGLRTKNGVTNKTWSKFAGKDIGNLRDIFSSCQEAEEFIDAGLLELDDRGVRASSAGLSVIDGIIPHLALHLEHFLI
ncbi:radical S-adenosyl methionine domain-containing protein 1, mitochondrial-like isoform X2 [Actinia tenebrosa]|nr:radical S-adenosyl methionine domain-containing protein 1, mitochondrial-like isoform X2 [Actinia tenebrosa]